LHEDVQNLAMLRSLVVQPVAARCREGEGPREPKPSRNARKSGLAGTLALP
jgi:hypothetical protein